MLLGQQVLVVAQQVLQVLQVLVVAQQVLLALPVPQEQQEQV